MIAVKEARKFIEGSPESPAAKVLTALVIALESGKAFPLHQLYTLNFAQFEMAIKILEEWRLDRYYSSKGRLLDLSLQASQMAVAKT